MNNIENTNGNGYIAFYNGKRLEIRADSLYAAHQGAIAQLKIPKSKKGLLAVVLVELAGGKPVIHSTASI